MKKLIWISLVFLFLISVTMVYFNHVQHSKSAAVIQDAVETSGLRVNTEPGSVFSGDAEPAGDVDESEFDDVPVLLDFDIDLAALQNTNPDVVGWIVIPETELSYPLLHGDDNEYYLSHTWQGEYNSAGSVFLEATNSPDCADFHSIVYGHNMRNGSMFGSLKQYKDFDYWQAHPSVYLILSSGVYQYDIFAAGNSSVGSVVFRNDIEAGNLQDDFVEYCISQSVIDTGIVPDASSRFLTLSTCTGNGYDARWTVHAVLSKIPA